MRTFVCLTDGETVEQRRSLFGKMYRLGYPVRFDEDTGYMRIGAPHRVALDSHGVTWFMIAEDIDGTPPGFLPADT